MRLQELFENSLNSSIRDAIGVMLARSETIGRPYSISMEKLAHIVSWPGQLNKAHIEKVLNDSPDLAAKIKNFDDDGIEVNANAEEEMPDMSMPPDMGDMGMPPDMGAAPDMGGDMGMSTDMGMPPDVTAASSDEGDEQVKKIDAVKKAAERAKARRGL